MQIMLKWKLTVQIKCFDKLIQLIILILIHSFKKLFFVRLMENGALLIYFFI